MSTGCCRESHMIHTISQVEDIALLGIKYLVALFMKWTGR